MMKNKLIDTSDLPLDNSEKCMIAHNPECPNKHTLCKLRAGMYLFSGIKNNYIELNKQIYKALKGQTDTFGDVRELHGKTALFCQPTLDDTTIIFGTYNDSSSNGAILVSRLTSDINLVAVNDINCVPYFDSKEQYQGDEFQCFCNNGLNGYVNMVDNRGVVSFSDMAVCGIDEVAKPIGYIRSDTYNQLKKVFNDVEKINELITPISDEPFDTIAYTEQMEEVNAYKYTKQGSGQENIYVVLLLCFVILLIFYYTINYIIDSMFFILNKLISLFA